jgi:serine-type D-Ala-D-Ala carboxypeptidase (penicillin-binding protein 5/6)
VLVVGALAALAAALAAWQLWPSSASSAAPAAAAAKNRQLAPRRGRAHVQPLLFIREPVAHRGQIGARAAILIDSGSGTVLWARRPHLRLPIASTTKIMTAVVALERLRPRQVIVVDRAAPRAQPFKEGLRAGERVPAWKLFYGLMLFSGNDDAVALAVAAGGTEAHFIALMNEKARLLGLRDTHIRSPSGIIDRGSYSTAWDLAALSRYAMRNPRFRAVVRTRVKRVSWAPPTYARVYVNHNHLLGTYPGADGIKTGWTTLAGHCLVASASRFGVHLIAVVLDSPDADGDARRLLNYGFRTRG